MRDESALEGLGDSAFEARLACEQDEQHERESKAFQARVRSYRAPPDSDVDFDDEHDSGEDEWRDE